jgi:UDP-glucose 4-epimerase
MIDFKDKTILVTGGAGFVGSHLCERLIVEGAKVISLDNYFTGSKDNHIKGVVYVEGHTRNIEKLVGDKFGKIDLVYHLGEYSRVEKSFEDPTDLLWDLNIAGTFSVLEFCKKRNTKIIYSGSSTKFAAGEDGKSMSPYAWSKSANTELVKNYGIWFKLPYAITYFYNVYGPGEISEGPYSTVLGIFKRQYQNDLPLTVVLPGDQKRNFTHIKDIVSALMLIGDKGEGDEYGIGSDESFSVREIAEEFNRSIIWMPERRGNRKSSEVISQKTKNLGWSPKENLKDYILQIRNNKTNNVNTNIKNKILVFATTFYPTEGLSEKAILEVIKSMPDVNFDIITTSIGDNSTVDLPKNVKVYRVVSKKDLALKGFEIAKKLSGENNYAFVWSVMTSYGTYPAIKIKNYLRVPLLITLGDQYIPNIYNLKFWLLKYLSSEGDQVSSSAFHDVNMSRNSNVKMLTMSNKKGDTFSNAFRFLYNEKFKKSTTPRQSRRGMTRA